MAESGSPGPAAIPYMIRSMSNDSPVALSTLPASRGERRLLAAVVLLSVVTLLAVAPFAKQRLPQIAAFLPVYQSALVVCDLVTATLLFGQFAILRSRALLVLAGGYLFSAAMAVLHALSFPGLLSPAGVFGSGPQTTAWLYFMWHAGFAAALVAYALLPRAAGPGPRAGSAGGVIAAAIAVALAAAVALMLLATAGHDFLPVIMRGDEDSPAKYAVAWATWLTTLAALPLLWRRRPLSVLDLWLTAVVCAWLCDVALAAVFNAGRFSLGWYAGRVYGLAASSFVLAVLLLENGELYARLARALEGERSERRRAEERTEQLDEANASLEHRIAERTAELERSSRELHEIATAGASAREQEKSRVARELHDELAQALTALKMDLAWLKERAPRGDGVGAKLEEMHALLDATVAATRRISADLRPLVLDDLGLVAATQWLVEGFRQRHGIECTLLIDPPGLELGDPHATAVFRIVQESLTNVARHAGASRVEVELRLGSDAIRVRVRDDGRGFEPAGPRRPASFGLVGLRERAHLVSGRIEIDTAPGRGTTVEVWIPLAPGAERAGG